MTDQANHPSICPEVISGVYSYLDNELDQHHRERIVEHLDACPPCGQQYAREQAVRALIVRASTCSGAPESLRVTIRAQITTITSVTQIQIRYTD